VRLLLDTHAWIWLLDDPARLSTAAAEAIREANQPLSVSAISAWEVARKESLGKLTLAMASHVWLERASRAPGIELLQLTPAIAWESCHLPGEFHRDPADQIIVATARVHGLRLITADQRRRAYPMIQTLW